MRVFECPSRLSHADMHSDEVVVFDGVENVFHAFLNPWLGLHDLSQEHTDCLHCQVHAVGFTLLFVHPLPRKFGQINMRGINKPHFRQLLQVVVMADDELEEREKSCNNYTFCSVIHAGREQTHGLVGWLHGIVVAIPVDKSG